MNTPETYTHMALICVYICVHVCVCVRVRELCVCVRVCVHMYKNMLE